MRPLRPRSHEMAVVVGDMDVAGLILRAGLAVVMLAHGWNHLLGPGGVAGTARWFESMGLRPPRAHALASGITELAAGAGLALGLLTSVHCGAVVGVMTVALVTAHRSNGFFIFRPGQGWEYVGFLALTAVAVAVLGPGSTSLDGVLGIADDLDGAAGLALSAGLGMAGAAGLLVACWRPAEAS
jgi:putative oxidoreductase